MWSVLPMVWPLLYLFPLQSFFFQISKLIVHSCNCSLLYIPQSLSASHCHCIFHIPLFIYLEYPSHLLFHRLDHFQNLYDIRLKLLMHSLSKGLSSEKEFISGKILALIALLQLFADMSLPPVAAILLRNWLGEHLYQYKQSESNWLETVTAMACWSTTKAVEKYKNALLFLMSQLSRGLIFRFPFNPMLYCISLAEGDGFWFSQKNSKRSQWVCRVWVQFWVI